MVVCSLLSLLGSVESNHIFQQYTPTTTTTTTTTIATSHINNGLHFHLHRHPLRTIPRGGAAAKAAVKDPEAMKRYQLSQQHLLQLKSTYLSEALAQRGIHVGPTLTDVSTPEGAKPPQETDWDCTLSTTSNPKSCLYSFDAEPNTKVICPIGTDQYISLGALNRLRRTDPTKVEPMWHSQYAILNSWFNDQSQFSLLQFVGWKGFIVSTILLDLGKGMALRGLLMLSVASAILIFLPAIEFIVSRLLTSSVLWMKWQSWGRFVHAALPLKILIGQMMWKFLAGSFAKLESFVRDAIVDLECAILEESIPVTIRDGDSSTGGMDYGEEDDKSVGTMDSNDDDEEEEEEEESEEEDLNIHKYSDGDEDMDNQYDSSEYDQYDDDY